jgi:hypothetical protein
MFQYAFARKYAEVNGLTLHTKPHHWQHVFDIQDEPPIDGLHSADNSGWHEWEGKGGFSIVGLSQHQRCLTYTRSDCRRWFKLKPEVEELVKDVPSMEIVANLRRGDYCYSGNPFVVVSEGSYLACCDKFGLPKDKIFWLNGETHYRVPGIPLDIPWDGLNQLQRWSRFDFVPDLVLMMRAKILLRSNSTFAWWAATLGNNERVFCPDLTGIDPTKANIGPKRLPQDVPFVEGNHTPVAWGYDFLSDLYLEDNS